MSKKLEVKGITQCGECPCYYESTCHHEEIGRTIDDERESEIIDQASLPDWCPLPDEEA